jgi:hypothetical protein
MRQRPTTESPRLAVRSQLLDEVLVVCQICGQAVEVLPDTNELGPIPGLGDDPLPATSSPPAAPTVQRGS